jgi:hypothetical protein
MTGEPRGRDLFIVDNSVSGWTGLRYLEEWTGIAKGFDIARVTSRSVRFSPSTESGSSWKRLEF